MDDDDNWESSFWAWIESMEMANWLYHFWILPHTDMSPAGSGIGASKPQLAHTNVCTQNLTHDSLLPPKMPWGQKLWATWQNPQILKLMKLIWTIKPNNVLSEVMEDDDVLLSRSYSTQPCHPQPNYKVGVVLTSASDRDQPPPLPSVANKSTRTLKVQSPEKGHLYRCHTSESHWHPMSLLVGLPFICSRDYYMYVA